MHRQLGDDPVQTAMRGMLPHSEARMRLCVMKVGQRGRWTVSAFPERAVGSACALSLLRLARRLLALRPCTLALSPYIVTR
jgi:hypothetical protein